MACGAHSPTVQQITNKGMALCSPPKKIATVFHYGTVQWGYERRTQDLQDLENGVGRCARLVHGIVGQHLPEVYS
jgi:hypothetical protein